MTTSPLHLAASAALLLFSPLAAPTALAEEGPAPCVKSLDRVVLTLTPEAAEALTEAETLRLAEILDATHAAVQADFPALADGVRVELGLMDRDLEMVGGVTGRADAPGEIVISVSTLFPGGTAAAIETGLASTFAHELHHLVRGWTIRGNHFGPGIDIAAVNEGLAVVYAESLTGASFAGNTPPDAQTAQAWALEVRALPRNANYGEWMFQHPDGRMAVGYRAGSFLVREALGGSGLSVIELSEKSPEEIWSLSGVE